MVEARNGETKRQNAEGPETKSGERNEPVRRGNNSLEMLLTACAVTISLQNIYVKVQGLQTSVDLIVPVEYPEGCSLEHFRELLGQKLRNVASFSFTRANGERVRLPEEQITMVTDVTEVISVSHHTFDTQVQRMQLKLVPSPRPSRKRRRPNSLQRVKFLLKRLRLMAPQQLRSLNLGHVFQKLQSLTGSQ